MKNIMKSVELEMNMREMDKVMDSTVNKIDIQLVFIEAKYAGNTLRDMNLINEVTSLMNKLYVLTTGYKDIEHQAIKIDDMELYFKCEARVSKLIGMMECIRNEYLL